WPLRTRSPSSTARRTTLPGTSALTLTCVFGSILPGALTREVTSSIRTLASWTDSTLPPEERPMFTATRMRTSTTPITIHSHFFFIESRLLCWRSLAVTADAVDLRLGHTDGGQGLDDVALCGLQLHLGVDQLQDGGGPHVVLLLRQLEVLDGRFQA